MNLEYGHVYVEDILSGRWKEQLLNFKEEKIIFENFKGVKIVLIDDKDYNLSLNEKTQIQEEVKDLYITYKMPPDFLYFEKDFNENAIRIYDSIEEEYKKTVYFKKHKKYVDFLVINGEQIAVRERNDEKIRNYCVMLSTAFSVYKKEKYDSNHIVLPKSYKKIEDNVSTILSSINKNYINTYFFY